MDIQKLFFSKKTNQNIKNNAFNKTNNHSSDSAQNQPANHNFLSRLSLNRRFAEIKSDGEGLSEKIIQLPQIISDTIDNSDSSMLRLSEISENLQACFSVEEAYRVFSDWMQQFFPSCSGHLFSVDVSADIVKSVLLIGNRQYSEIEFHLNDCRALRQGKKYYVDARRSGFRCKHLLDEESLSYTLCIPMLARGKNFGLFSIGIENLRELSESEFRLIDKVVKQLTFAVTNISEREDLQQQSTIEPLTNLFNRRYLEDFLTREIVRAERYQREIGLIFCDVDYFKSINDIHGHEAGDIVLVNIANLLKENVRESDIICRCGGEEIIIVLLETSLENTRIKAENIRKKIASLTHRYGDKNLKKITASFGVSCYPKHGNTVKALVAAADKAMYEAKENGRNRVEVARNP
jgi:diguanylate cyclase (GGDEF)-like protein